MSTGVAHPKRLLVLGAGPKAIALAAKASVLTELGFRVPEVLIVEKANVAAHWDGSIGLTDGEGLLSTPPQKDVGFPYRSRAWGNGFNEAVDQAMRSFSWQAYLTEEPKAPGPYWQWVDRGMPPPVHREWARYLRWANRKAKANVKFGEVSCLSIQREAWLVSGYDEAGGFSIPADGLVVTGAGRSSAGWLKANAHPHLLDAFSVWRADIFRWAGRGPTSVAIIGAGETAAAILEALARHMHPQSFVHVVARQGTIFSRSESYSENHVFSQPTTWTSLSYGDRIEFIRRTDRGVFSLHAQQRLAPLRNVEVVPGNVDGVVAGSDCVEVLVSYCGTTATRKYDWVIDATPLDPAWFLGLLAPSARSTLPEDIGAAIGHDLSVDGVHPPLHLPMLAGLRQGPGFPNLSCLGLLSDRILSRYVEKPAPPTEWCADAGLA